MPCTARILEVNWLGCASHKLQLTIKATLKVQENIETVIQHVHKIAGSFNSSTVALSAPHDDQENQGLVKSHPPLDVSLGLTTRFNSTHKSVDWISQNEVAINLALVVECTGRKNTVTVPPESLSNTVHDIMLSALPLLKPIAEATAILSSDATVNVSMIFPCLLTLKDTLGSLRVDGIMRFQQELLSQLDHYFDLEKDITLAATFLNPKFKELLFNNVQAEIAKKFITNLIVSKKENNAAAENAVADVEVTLNRPTPAIAENDAHALDS